MKKTISALLLFSIAISCACFVSAHANNESDGLFNHILFNVPIPNISPMDSGNPNHYFDLNESAPSFLDHFLTSDHPQ